MQKVIELIQTHTYDFFIPLTALALLRLGLCLAQLKKTASIRKKKGVYHAVRGHYTEIGVWLGVLPACVLGLVLPKLWYAWLALGIVAATVLGKAGQRKGTELDGIYRRGRRPCEGRRRLHRHAGEQKQQQSTGATQRGDHDGRPFRQDGSVSLMGDAAQQGERRMAGQGRARAPKNGDYIICTQPSSPAPGRMDLLSVPLRLSLSKPGTRKRK